VRPRCFVRRCIILTCARAGTDWQKIIIAAHKKYKEEGGDWWNEGYPKTTDAMMDKFRAHKAAAEAEKAAAAEEADDE
jgi:hypothetical protein